MVEKMAPEEAVTMLNEYFTVMTEEVFKEEGTVDKFIGDCLMAIFGAPIAHPDDPLRAVRTALGMRRALKGLKEQWLAAGRRFGKPLDLAAFEIGIGINTGSAIAGNIGSEKRMDYTVISDAVNLASRLEGVAASGEVLISQETYREVEGKVQVVPKPPVRVQGKSEPIVTYAVQSLR
jgi:adenylate cyclase